MPEVKVDGLGLDDRGRNNVSPHASFCSKISGVVKCGEQKTLGLEGSMGCFRSAVITRVLGDLRSAVGLKWSRGTLTVPDEAAKQLNVRIRLHM